MTLWVAASRRRDWGRLGVGVAVLVLSQLVLQLGIGELHQSVGLDPHVSLIRNWASVGPVLVAGLIKRPVRVADPPTALEPALAGRD